VKRALAIVLVVAACSASDKTVERADVACLDTYGPEIAAAVGSANAAGDVAAVLLSWQALRCMASAFHVKAPTRDAGHD